tara:strand:+ start:10 stop:1068 length:1059 start_codon:yes stop_codon:yes gene_type:complete
MAYISFQPNDFFNTLLYTGNGSTQSLTGMGFQPDFTWIKTRSNSSNHQIHNSVAAYSYYYNRPNTSAAEITSNSTTVTAFDSDGFSLGNDGVINESGYTYASWNWKAGTTSGLTGGTITPSAYSINTTSGMGIYQYTGNSTGGATIPHGLGQAPQCIIVKHIASGSDYWNVNFFNSPYLGNTGRLYLNEEDGNSATAAAWNSTAPTSTLITLGSNGEVNASGAMLLFAFAPVKGFSAMGEFKGNGDTRGCFIQTGFRPGFVLIKRVNGVGPWMIYHNKVPGYNETNTYLQANATSAEDTNAGNFGMSMYATGFQPQSTSGATGPNQDGDTYCYLAFADKSIASSNSIAGTAR